MARVFPFQPYRYSAAAGRPADLVTQPYDKITPEMRTRYLGLSPHNLVRVILGEPQPGDGPGANVYIRAAAHFDDWIRHGILVREPDPALFAYSQSFRDPDTGDSLTRDGFIGLGAVEDYSAGVVYRHEHTLSGPKKDRLEVLSHTRAHFGQIFMLYDDPARETDAVLAEARAADPLCVVEDEYGVGHSVWRVAQPERIERLRQLMAPRKLLIADGHHRYETALTFRGMHPEWEGAGKVMMTFVNMCSPGLRILATHRLVGRIPGFDAARFLADAGRRYSVRELPSAAELRDAWNGGGRKVVFGAAIGNRLFLLERESEEAPLEVALLHQEIIEGVLGISAQAVRNESLRYIRGLDAAIEQARAGAAEIALLLRPVSVAEVARISFAGGVMPQKSTDFYPKLLSGLTIYKVDE
jgi:uncharacterized protein (DUF1015 family)